MTISIRGATHFLFAASVFLFAFEQVYVVAGLSDSFVKPYRVTALLGIALIAISREKLPIQVRRLLAVLFVVYAWGVVLALGRSAFLSTDFGTTLHFLQLFLIGFSILYLAVIGIKRPEQINRLLILILVSAILSSSIWLALNWGQNIYRATGFFRNPNHFAYMLSLSMLIAFYLLAHNLRKVGLAILLLAWVFISIILIVLTGSRGAIATTVPAIALFLFRYVTEPGRAQGTRSFVALTVLAALAMSSPYLLQSGLFSDRLLERFSAAQVETGSGRFDIWQAGLLAAGDVLYTGIGMGQYINVHSYYINQVPGNVYSTVLDYDLGLHSEYVSLFVEFGLLGLLAYLGCLFAIWRQIRRFGRMFPQWRHLRNILEAMLVFNVFFSLSQEMYIFPYHWVVLGLGASTFKFRKSDVRNRFTGTPDEWNRRPVLKLTRSSEGDPT